MMTNNEHFYICDYVINKGFQTKQQCTGVLHFISIVFNTKFSLRLDQPANSITLVRCRTYSFVVTS